MAQNDDFIEFILKTIFQFFSWIFLGIIKLIVLIISGIVKGIASLFKKDSSSETVNNE